MWTEAEAKTKWCPMARVSPAGQHNLWNRTKADAGAADAGTSDGHARMSRCIGSACMAWRSYDDPEFKRAADEAYRRDGRRLTDERRPGFCGLAGRPS